MARGLVCRAHVGVDWLGLSAQLLAAPLVEATINSGRHLLIWLLCCGAGSYPGGCFKHSIVINSSSAR